MENFLLYMGKVGAAIAIMVTAYLVFFRKENLLWFNRFYLLITAMVLWTIPLFTLTFTRTLETLPAGIVTMMRPATLNAVVEMRETVPASPADLIILIPVIVYAAVSLFFLLRLFLSFLKVRFIIARCARKQLCGETVYVTEEDLIPFSFFGKRVISRDLLNHPHVDLVLRHEKLHARQGHSYDILITEIVKALQWFNPFAWMLATEVKANLEYMADAGTAKAGADVEQYQYLLVSLANGNMPVQLVSGLIQTQLKKRMIMMKKQIHPPKLKIRYLMVLPLVTGLFFTFCSKETVYDASSSDYMVTGFVTNDRTEEPVEGVMVSVKGQDMQVLTNEYGAYSIRLSAVDDTLRFGQNVYVLPAGRTAVNVSLSPGITYRPVDPQMNMSPYDEVKWYVNGSLAENGINDTDKPFMELASIQGLHTETGIRNDGSLINGNYIFILVFTKENDAANPTDDKHKPAETIPLTPEVMTTLSDTIMINGNDTGPLTPLYIVDGIYIEEGQSLKLHPNAIRTVRSFHGDQAYSVIPTEAAWLRGVVMIETR